MHVGEEMRRTNPRMTRVVMSTKAPRPAWDSQPDQELNELVQVKRLAMHWSPFTNPVWHGMTKPITEREIRQAIEQGRLYPPCIEYQCTSCSRAVHAARIAWLVVNGWDTPIELDVGVPSLGCCIEWIVCDGHHRLAAAIYRKDRYILAGISGSVSHKHYILGRTRRAA